MTMSSKIVFLILALLNFEAAFGHFCYSCNQSYKYNDDEPHDVCASKFMASQLLNITCRNMTDEDIKRGAKHVCFKLERKRMMLDNKTFVYERGCTTKGGSTDFCAEIAQNNPKTECFLCEENNCNDASDMEIIRFMMFFLAVFLVLYMRDQAERNHLRENRPLKW